MTLSHTQQSFAVSFPTSSVACVGLTDTLNLPQDSVLNSTDGTEKNLKKLKKNLDIYPKSVILVNIERLKMTESERLAFIKNAVANATKIVPQKFKGLLDELKAEKATEDFITANGLLPVSDDEVKEEFVSLDAVESDKDDDDFDNDENLVDMDSVSESMREIFGE